MIGGRFQKTKTNKQTKTAKTKACGQKIIKFMSGAAGILDRAMMKNSEKQLPGWIVFLLVKTHTQSFWPRWRHR